MDDENLCNLFKLLKQQVFSNNVGRWRPLADRWRGCGDASRALLLFLCKNQNLVREPPRPLIAEQPARFEAPRARFICQEMRSGSRRARRAVARIALEEQRLAGDG
jgi:hypothetical protein